MRKVKEERVYQFDPFLIDFRRRRLYKGSQLIQLPPKTYAILELLVENAGKLVEKEQILEKIWPDQYIEESNLSQHIHKLRKIFGDNPRSQDYILTVPGKGYTFNQEMKLLEHLPREMPGAESALVESLQRDGSGAMAGGQRLGGRSWPKWVPFIGAGLLIILGVVFGQFWFRRQWLSSSNVQVGKDQGKDVGIVLPLVTHPGEENYPAFSPDGRFIAFTSEGETRDNQDIYVRMIAEDVQWQLTSHPDEDIQPTWSPDGTRIAFLRSSGEFARPFRLIIVPVRGGGEEEIGEVRGGVSWSPDGQTLAVSDNEGVGTPTSLYLISVDGGERKKLLTPPVHVYDTNQQFSPDGRKIAFVRWENSSSAELYVYTLGNGNLQQLTNDERNIPDFHWGANSEEIYFVSNRQGNNLLWRVQLAGGQPVPVPRSPVNLNSITISPDETQLAYVQPITDTLIDIKMMGKGGSSEQRMVCRINSSRADDSPRFSPDGTRVAFVSTRSGFDEIWVANSDCSNPYQLTRFNQLGVGSPRWSPDGQTIVFDRNIDGNTDIFTIRVNGTALRQLTNDKAVENMPSWSADGQWVYFGSYKTAVSRIYRIPAEGGEAEPVTMSLGCESIESADGRTLYYTNGDRLWRKDLRSGREEALPELAKVKIGRYWDIAGSTLYYASSPADGYPVVTSFNLESRRSTRLFELSGSLAHWVPGIVFNPTANLLAVSYVAVRHGDLNVLTNWK